MPLTRPSPRNDEESIHTLNRFTFFSFSLITVEVAGLLLNEMGYEVARRCFEVENFSDLEDDHEQIQVCIE